MSNFIRCYNPDGTYEDIPHDLSYTELNQRLGGYLQFICFEDLTIIVDEEGRIKPLPRCGIINRDFPVTLFGEIYAGHVNSSDIDDDDEDEESTEQPLLLPAPEEEILEFEKYFLRTLPGDQQ